MLPALTQALTLLGTDRERDRLLVLVTDGQVGNEAQILQALGEQLAAVRVFVVGIDQAVNAGLLERLARRTGGHCELVESEDRLDAVLEALHRRLEAPVLTDLRLQPEGFVALAESLAPTRLPDLFPSTALVVAGRYRGQPGGSLVLTGTDGNGQRWEERVTGAVTARSALTAVWARAHLLDLEDRLDAGVGDRADLERRLVWTSLRYKVLCRFTAYVAVDRTAVIEGTGQPHRIVQPVELPAGWNPEAGGIARRQASSHAWAASVSFCIADTAEARPLKARPPVDRARVELFEELAAVFRAIVRQPETLSARPDHLEQCHELLVRLQHLRQRARELGFPDSELAPLEALLSKLERLLSLVEELRRVDADVHRLAGELHERTVNRTETRTS
jgi:Ca-activated chloride channel family protein